MSGPRACLSFIFKNTRKMVNDIDLGLGLGDKVMVMVENRVNKLS